MPIFDQGYQHWQGPLSGHAWRWLAIARNGVRVQMKNRIVRMLMLLSWLPALMLVAFVAVWGMVEQKNQTVVPLLHSIGLPDEMLNDPVTYRSAVWTLSYSYFFSTQMYCIMLLVVVAGPGLISRDLRFNALPLYFARPLTRFDYFVGKLGVVGALVAAVAVGPAILAYFVGLCFSLDLSVVKDTWAVLLGSIAYGLLVTLSVGALILALSSLTRRSLYVGITFAGLWLISASVATIMTGIYQESARQGYVADELDDWLKENPPPAGIQMHGNNAVMMVRHVPQDPSPDQQHAEQARQNWMAAYHRNNQMAWMKSRDYVTQAVRADWRPLCSYVGNLSRMKDLLLDTDTAWVTYGKAELASAPGRGRPGAERELADRNVAQFPWWWSAAVLAGLLGISTWILTMRVKSLDRLK